MREEQKRIACSECEHIPWLSAMTPPPLKQADYDRILKKFDEQAKK